MHRRSLCLLLPLIFSCTQLPRNAMEGRRNHEPQHTEGQRGEYQRLELAGVPVLLRPPADPDAPAPLIVLWHGFGPPGSEEALAKTLPPGGRAGVEGIPGIAALRIEAPRRRQ